MPKRIILHTTNSSGYACFLALLPIIMVYKSPGIGIGLSTLLILVGILYAAIVIFSNSSRIDIKIIWPILAYLLYIMTKSTGESLLLPVIVLIHVIAISTGAIKVNTLRKTVEMISVIAAVCLILQVIVHAITGFHIPMIQSSLILDSLEVYKQPIENGYSVVERIYRPSAFFLEPSHFTQYCIVGLGSSLFKDDRKINKSILISIGILLTTSGMGFILVFAMWSWWYVAQYGFRTILKNAGRVIEVIIVVPIAVYLLSRTSFFGGIIARFMQPETTGNYNAISGRLFWWDTYFGGLTWRDLITGFGSDSLPDRYFTGFMTVLYAYGVIGVVLFLLSYFNIAIRGHKLERTLGIMYIGLFFIANLTSMISLIFGFGMMISLYEEDRHVYSNE